MWGGALVTVRSGLAFGSAVLVALLVVLGSTVGLVALGWGVGLGCSLVMGAAVARGATGVLGPADLVTGLRAVLACGVAALVAASFVQQPAVRSLVGLTVAALVLDAVDGWVARRTRTASTFGARFDGEVDAFLILVLSVYVAQTLAGWALAIGAARYAFLVAGWCFPWLRGQLPPRYWRKVVAATQGIVLTIAAASAAPGWLTYTALAVALALLIESFGRDVLWLWHHRRATPAQVTSGPAPLHLQRP
ncbi:MAG: CDP-alcohol phosphatidyltransferase family protein [Propionibacteriales bacterium]|nr:CDP-alcohol phosphatidyltransferase family protein [Propionibacteriales bacterium]